MAIRLYRVGHFESRFRALICVAAFSQISCTWLLKCSFESRSMPMSLTLSSGLIVHFLAENLMFLGISYPKQLLGTYPDWHTCGCFQTRIDWMLNHSRVISCVRQHHLLLC